MTRILTQTAANPTRQKGAALLVSLIILLVLTVLALSSMQGTSMQEKMVSSQRDAQIALEGAEAALDAVEADLAEGGALSSFVPNSQKGLYGHGDTVPTDLLNPNTWKGEGTVKMARKNNSDERLEKLAETPRYFIKETFATGSAASGGFGIGIGDVGDGTKKPGFSGKVYRVVTFSTGASGQAARAIEAYIIRTE